MAPDAATAWPPGTPCEFLFDDKWYRAISRGGVGEVLELAEVRARGVSTPVQLDEVASNVAAKGTHLFWTDADERKLRPEKRPLSPQRQEEPISEKKASKEPVAPEQSASKRKAASKPAAATTKHRASQKSKKGPDPWRSSASPSSVSVGADGDGARPRRAAAKRGVSAMRSSLAEDDSWDALSSEDEGEDGARRAAQRKKRAAAATTRRVPRQETERDYDDLGETVSEEAESSEVSEYEASSDDAAPRQHGKAKAKAKGRGKKDDDDSGDKPQQSLSKEDRAAEAKEWAAIQAAPPPPQWKVPAEAPGLSKVRELRSRRGHLAQWHAGTASKRSNFQPPFLDSPFDINDRGVAHNVTAQARKLRGLLEEALRAGELPPIALQTLCSGTDAPAIALDLVCKELSERGLTMSVEHTMSCENEPFKQAYIARNFAGVTLFNDVVELAAAAEAAAGTAAAGRATTSFGGERKIPRAAPGQRSLLVAGTSCKDFPASLQPCNFATLLHGDSIKSATCMLHACNPGNPSLQPFRTSRRASVPRASRRTSRTWARGDG